MKKDRIRVHIHCRNCGERFTLRGNKGGKGKYGTGFKKCLCNNQDHFYVRTEEEL